MSKKMKNEADNPHSHPYERNATEKSQNCEVKVRGAIEVHPSPSSVDLHHAERKIDEDQKEKENSFAKNAHNLAKYALLASVIYSFLTLLIFWQAKKAADAARDSVRIADTSMKISQRAYVTIGRKDGVVADFIIPKDPKQNAEIVIYFQNSGHMPAKFFWGTMAPFLAQGSKKNSTGITWTHPFKGFPTRTRDKKNGSIGEQGESSVITGDSIFVSTLGVISQKDLAMLPMNDMGLLIIGEYGYCDELGNSANRMFGLTYRSNAPSSSLSFGLANEGDSPNLPLPKSTDTTEYLFPCKTLDER
jgi:hypothetical protein